MGSSNSKNAGHPDHYLSDQEILTYQEQPAAFKASELRSLYARFRAMKGTKSVPVPADKICDMPELKFNPFRGRIVRAFGAISENPMMAEEEQKNHRQQRTAREIVEASLDVTGLRMHFNDFVRMMHAFSARSHISAKREAAFQVFDFTDDHKIDTEDIQCILICAMGAEAFSSTDIQKMANEIMMEADLDGNKQLDESEFGRILNRIPEFMSKFQFTIQF